MHRSRTEKRARIFAIAKKCYRKYVARFEQFVLFLFRVFLIFIVCEKKTLPPDNVNTLYIFQLLANSTSNRSSMLTYFALFALSSRSITLRSPSSRLFSFH